MARAWLPLGLLCVALRPPGWGGIASSGVRMLRRRPC